MPATHPSVPSDEEKRMREVCYVLGWFMFALVGGLLIYAMFF